VGLWKRAAHELLIKEKSFTNIIEAVRNGTGLQIRQFSQNNYQLKSSAAKGTISSKRY